MAENPTPTPGEYTADVGSGAQLGYGEATEANESLVAGDAIEEQIEATQIIPPGELPEDVSTSADFGVEYDDGIEETFRPANEDQEILFAPSEGLGGPKRPQKPVPNSVIRALPLMSTLAQDPRTPPAVRAAYAFILRRLEAEQEARFAR